MVLFLMGAGMAFAAEAANNDACTSCHDVTEAKYSKNMHATASCVSCHGEATEHQQDPSVLDMIDPNDPKQAETVNAGCMSCHAANQKMMFWEGSAHEAGDASCTSCHNIHTVGTETVEMDSCLSCHKDVRRDVNKFSHHPLKEGKMECSSCHDVHGTLAPALIKDADFTNELCYTCHTEKRGPYRFAHPPVEENCLSCHSAHGTNSPRLLTENLRNTCSNCHSYEHHPQIVNEDPGSRNTAMTRQASCLNCHGNIHGSNTDHHFR
jgi:DmsE family decaheme c-type cytochrome